MRLAGVGERAREGEEGKPGREAGRGEFIRSGLFLVEGGVELGRVVE